MRRINKIRVYPIEIDVNESDEIIISQDRRGDASPSSVTISPDQIDHLYKLLQQAQREIEDRRNEEEEDEDDEVEDHRGGRPGRR